MKQKLLPVLAAAIVFAACTNEKKEDKPANETGEVSEVKETKWIPVDSATAMKAWTDYAAIGEPHKMMAKANGIWTGTTTSWMADGVPPMTSTSTSTNKMIMDGRYQVTEFSGDMMGMPFKGMGIMGYDNYKKTYFSTWIDNMGSGIMLMEGPWDEASKSITMTGKYKNPANGLDCEMKEVFKFVDDNTQLMEMYGPDQQTGKQYKTMEIKFSRKK
jgi:hypothetical protein